LKSSAAPSSVTKPDSRKIRLRRAQNEIDKDIANLKQGSTGTNVQLSMLEKEIDRRNREREDRDWEVDEI